MREQRVVLPPSNTTATLPQQSVREKRVRTGVLAQSVPQPPVADSDSNDALTDDDSSNGGSFLTSPQLQPRPTRSLRRPARFNNNVNLASFVTFADQANAAADIPSGLIPTSLKQAKAGPDAALWEQEETNEWTRLLETRQAIRFISWSKRPAARMVSYYNPQVAVKSKNGQVVRRVRAVYGGNRSDYCGPKSSSTADHTTVKLFLNAAVSEAADLGVADIADFYLMSDLPYPEYMRVHRSHVTPAIQARYCIDWKDDHALLEVVKAIYGLPQAGLIAHIDLVQHLGKFGFHPAEHTPCLFIHESRPVMFTLVVDDFLFKATGPNSRQHIDHLLAALKAKYEITVDQSQRLRYIGMTIDYDRVARTITTSVPNYVANALASLGVARGTRRTDSALVYVPPVYGPAAQQIAPIDDSPLMPPAQVKFLQRICGIFLWYARITDPTMLCPISKLSSDQARPTIAVAEARDRFLQYAAWHPDAAIVYRATDMRYVVHSDASFLTEADAHSRAGGIGFLTDNDSQNYLAINGAVECISRIIPTVTASICETEYAAQFINGQSAEGVRNTLCDLGYPQPATDVVADNKCAVGLANRTMKQRRSKSIHNQYHWIRDRVSMGHFNILWKPGSENFADYFTKAHPVHHVRSMRHLFVATPVFASSDLD